MKDPAVGLNASPDSPERKALDVFAFAAFNGHLGLGHHLAELHWELMPEQDKHRWRLAVVEIVEAFRAANDLIREQNRMETP